MAVRELYRGEISGSQIVTAMGSVSAANLIILSESNGQQVTLIADG